MVSHSRKNPRWIFAVRRLKASDIEILAAWAGSKGAVNEGVRDRVSKVFNRHYHHLWHSRHIRSWVMTVNGRPVFCLSLLQLTEPGRSTRQESGCDYHLYLLASPAIGRDVHQLRRAWQAAAVYAFLGLGVAEVQVGVDAFEEGENDALVMMGFRLVETTREGLVKTNLYVCRRDEFRPVL